MLLPQKFFYPDIENINENAVNVVNIIFELWEKLPQDMKENYFMDWNDIESYDKKYSLTNIAFFNDNLNVCKKCFGKKFYEKQIKYSFFKKLITSKKNRTETKAIPCNYCCFDFYKVKFPYDENFNTVCDESFNIWLNDIRSDNLLFYSSRNLLIKKCAEHLGPKYVDIFNEKIEQSKKMHDEDTRIKSCSIVNSSY